LQVDADVWVQRQSKDVWRESRFHGDGFWLSVPIFVGYLGVFDVVSLAVTVRFLRWSTRM